jgi:hypothetical protein
MVNFIDQRRKGYPKTMSTVDQGLRIMITTNALDDFDG